MTFYVCDVQIRPFVNLFKHRISGFQSCGCARKAHFFKNLRFFPKLFYGIINDSEYGVLYDQTPTRSAGNTISSTDVTITHSSVNKRDGRHRNGVRSPSIIVEVQRHISKIKDNKRTYTNFSKVDWPGFTNFLDEIVSNATLTMVNEI